MIAGAGVGVATASEDTKANCAEKMIFEVGGHRDPTGKAYDKGNAALPAGVSFTKVKYPAEISPFPGDKKTLDESVEIGLTNIRKAVKDYRANCANSHITIAGYSEGAIVAGDYLLELSKANEVPHNQVNGVLYGDPRRPGNGGAGGIMGNIPSVLEGLTMKGQRPDFGDIPVKEICNKNDGICHSENPITNLLAFANGVAGYFQGDHGYDIKPHAVSGDGDQLIDQPPRVQYGAPLPIPSPTPYELLEGKLPAEVKKEVTKFVYAIKNVLPQEVWDKIREIIDAIQGQGVK
ncbi:PE-PPE domain-containing protein [Streptomyces sp. NPDC005438]|uniref:PE-PPE domain-containing protein n=1 Tax=Streptomyces sp. NPDC005438 TaxID=3156880 RepID=UPI0033ACD945